MKHKASRELFEYWNRLRGEAPAPLRSAIEPSDIRRILADTFIAEASGYGDFDFRLAGTRICALYGHELKGASLLHLWQDEDRKALATLATAVSEEGAVAVVTTQAQCTAQMSVACELCLMPLRHGPEGFDRLIGAFSPLETAYWLGSDPVVRQRITALRLIWPDDDADSAWPARRQRDKAARRAVAAAAANPIADQGRRHGHLYVVDGGKR